MKNAELFRDVRKISSGVSELSRLIIELGSSSAGSALAIAELKVIGKRISHLCDVINEEIDDARKVVGGLMLHEKSIIVGSTRRSLFDIEADLIVIHGLLDILGNIASRFFESSNREAALSNVVGLYDRIKGHVSLLFSDLGLK